MVREDVIHFHCIPFMDLTAVSPRGIFFHRSTEIFDTAIMATAINKQSGIDTNFYTSIDRGK